MKRIFLLTLALALLLSGCAGRFGLRKTGGETTIGGSGSAAGVERLTIDWRAGAVYVLVGTGSEVSFSEQANETLSAEQQLHWSLQDGRLSLRAAAPGVAFLPEKTLTVTLPASFAGKEITIRTASASVHTDLLKTEQLTISTASGDSSAAAEAKTVELDTASGALSFAGTASRLRLHSASGDLQVQGTAETLELNTASGQVDCTAAAQPAALRVETASGDVTLTLPETPGFTLELDTASGSFQSALPLQISGARFLCGDGSGDYTIHTASGDVSLRSSSEA